MKWLEFIERHGVMRWSVNFLLIVALAVFSTWTFRDREAQRHDARLAVAEADYQSCLRIEKVKAEFRKEAWKSFNDLNKTLRLLHVEKTPEIVEAAREARRRKVRRFRPFDCHNTPTQTLT